MMSDPGSWTWLQIIAVITFIAAVAWAPWFGL
jgi:hypothetical protein